MAVTFRGNAPYFAMPAPRLPAQRSRVLPPGGLGTGAARPAATSFTRFKSGLPTAYAPASWVRNGSGTKNLG